MLEGHREQEEAEDLVALQLSHVEVYSRLYEEPFYALLDSFDLEVAGKGGDFYLSCLSSGFGKHLDEEGFDEQLLD